MSFADVYKNAIAELCANIVKSIFSDILEETVIVTIPRKGPRLIDLFKERFDFNIDRSALICSEHSLPFLFSDKKLVRKIKRVVIVDDAVYYGTTITGVYNIVNTYKSILGLDFEISIIAGIKDSRANVQSLKIQCYNDIPQKFGYYYIKRLSKDLSELNSTLEIEFPTFSYRFFCPDCTDVYSFCADSLKRFGRCKDTYIVDSYNRKSVTVLFSTESNSLCSFRKCRFNIRKSRDEGWYDMNLTVMSPFVLSNEEVDLKMIFDDYEQIRPIWNQLISEAMPNSIQQAFKVQNTNDMVSDSSIMYSEIERLRKRSIVIAANYIVSSLFFMQIKNELEQLFGSDRLIFQGLNVNDFNNIFGETEVSRNLLGILNVLISRSEHRSGLFISDFVDNGIDKRLRINHSRADSDAMIFEKNFPNSLFISSIFMNRVEELIGKSRDTAEAVTALFFLQNGLIEKATRRMEKFNYYRLFFGQTFASIRKFLSLKKFADDDENVERRINRLVDLKIDQCNVVPQYILDFETGNWRRVFRPGENEDLYLSQMARFVIFVYLRLADYWKVQDVPEYLLNGFLVYLTESNKQLEEDLYVRFSRSDNGKLLFLNEDNGKKTEVLDYLNRMKIFEKFRDFFRLSDSLSDDSLTDVTTLDRVLVQSKMEDMIKDVLNKISSYQLKQDTAYKVLNAYILRGEDLNRAKKEWDIVKNDMATFLDKKLTCLHDPESPSLESTVENRIIVHSFRYFSRYLAFPELMEDSGFQAFEQRLLQCKELYNLIIYLYLYQNSELTFNVLNKPDSPLAYPPELVDSLKTDFSQALSSVSICKQIKDLFLTIVHEE